MERKRSVQTAYGASPFEADYVAEEADNRHIIQLSDGGRSPQTLENPIVLNAAVKDVAGELAKVGVSVDQCEWVYKDNQKNLRGIDVSRVENPSYDAKVAPKPPGSPGTPSLDGESFTGEARLYEMKAMESAEIKELFRLEAENSIKQPEPAVEPPADSPNLPPNSPDL